ncbi:putative long-chain-fatty-acid--CoA ligase [Vibrio chagasii]|nr:putative long-chain-fatty-acid--CoA ligase [Vibrio chagasii]
MKSILDILDSKSCSSDATALRIWRQKRWDEWSWGKLKEQSSLVASALIQEGHKVGQSVAIMSPNMPEWTIADFGILRAGGVVVPIYPTSTIEQAEYILNDSGAKVMFAGQSAQIRVGLELQSKGVIETLVALDVEEAHKNLSADELSCVVFFSEWLEDVWMSDSASEILAIRSESAKEDDLATLIYTSGTTGEPKGVMLSHKNIMAQMSNHDSHLAIDFELDSLSLLPLSHVFERAWTFYVLYRGGRNTYLEDPSTLQRTLGRFSPTVMCSVPRVYEKMHTAILAKVSKAKSSKRAMFAWAVNIGKQVATCRTEGKKVPLLLSIKFALADRLVLSKIKANIFPKAKLLPVSGAKLSDEVNMFFQAIGVPVAYGFGMTETTATVSCYRSENLRLGTVGDIIPSIDVKISDDGNNEILIKGDTVTQGYFNKPDANKESFTSDGWFRTGDAGKIEDGRLVLTERIKELMKTSNGKYIAPQYVEGELIQEPLFEQVAVVADCKKFVSALIVPAFEALEEHARELGLAWKDHAELIEHVEIKKLIQSKLNEVQKNLAGWEQVKVFTLIPREFCMKRGELTPTMKLRRKVIESKFAEQIRLMYGETAPA